VLLVFGEDLITDAGFEASDFAKLDLLVQTHHSTNPTALAADIVLPSATFAEKRGSMINLCGRLQRLNRAVELPAQARDDWEILRDLGAIAADTFLIEDVFKAMATDIPEFKQLSLSKIGHQGTPVLETGYKIALLENERAAKAAGKIVG
jgi:NADH-quinone oxidoreductase subunit G